MRHSITVGATALVSVAAIAWRLSVKWYHATKKMKSQCGSASKEEDPEPETAEECNASPQPDVPLFCETGWYEGDGLIGVAPVDEATAARWLAATQMGFLAMGNEVQLVRRVRWLKADPGRTVIGRGDLADKLVLVVQGGLELYKEDEEDVSMSEDEEMVLLHERRRSSISAIGMSIDGDEEARDSPRHSERLEATIGAMEAVGKLSVVVSASSSMARKHRAARHRAVAGTGGVIIAVLSSSEVRSLSVANPAALLWYARRCVGRLHRVARFANTELVPRQPACPDATIPLEFPAAIARIQALALRLRPPSDPLSTTRSLRVAVGAGVAQLFGGFDFIDDKPSSDVGTGDGAIGDDAEVILTLTDDDFAWPSKDLETRELLVEVLIAVIAKIDVEVAAFSGTGMVRRWLQAGAVLLERGSRVPNHFFVVISGRIRVWRHDDDRVEESRRGSKDGLEQSALWREFGRGDAVGLAAVASGASTLQITARCVRDTELVAVPNSALLSGAAMWLKKLAGAADAPTTRPATVSTVAIVGVDDSGRAAAASLSKVLATALTSLEQGRAKRASEADALSSWSLDAAAPAYKRRLASCWLAEAEERHQFVVLDCFVDEGRSAASRFWTQFATSQADAVLVVVDAETSTAVQPRSVERDLVWRRPDAADRRAIVVMVHADHLVVKPGSTRKWLAHRTPARPGDPRVIHVARADIGDHRRLARIVAGRARAVVLGGGGGRGLAHLGVLDALRANDFVPDLVAGCSQGAFMSAAYALPCNDDCRLLAVERAASYLSSRLCNLFTVLNELTLVPFLAFFDGRGFSKTVKEALIIAATTVNQQADEHNGLPRCFDADYDIEDAWLPFFCVTTNLTLQRGQIHAIGSLPFAVRASMSVAELLPPCRDPVTNHLHTDGCYVSNLPVAEMRRHYSAWVVIGVSVVDSSGSEFQDIIAYDPYGVSGAWLLWQRARNAMFRIFLPGDHEFFSKRKVPSMSKVRAVLQTFRNRAQLREAIRARAMDLFLEITPVSEYSALSYWRFEKIAHVAKDYAYPVIRNWMLTQDKLASAAQRKGSNSSIAVRHNASLPALSSAVQLSFLDLVYDGTDYKQSSNFDKSGPDNPQRGSYSGAPSIYSSTSSSSFGGSQISHQQAPKSLANTRRETSHGLLSAYDAQFGHLRPIATDVFLRTADEEDLPRVRHGAALLVERANSYVSW